MFTAQTDSASLLHAIACRMVCALGGHTYQPTNHAGLEFTWAERQGHHLRVLFWLCYISDKDISLRSGQAPLLTEEFCDLAIPECCIGDPGLWRLKEKIYRLLFSPHSFKISDGELVFRIRQLDDDLESWRLSIPPEIRPKLSIPPIKTTSTQEPYVTPDIRCPYLQLEYHHIVTAIHTTVKRCAFVIHSSCNLSLEASRSTITFLKSSTTVLAEQEFSDVVFYATLAVVSLFIDILAHPQNAGSRAALSYLSSAIEIIQKMSRLIMELIDVRSCAIAKAERDILKTDSIRS
ncbi:hypothetical protein F4823DRAFT_637786 [Ustulina deusta]|nr:hypothetical protein F4823DRAFT_637786 [Ustulina deusta]